MGLGAHFDHGDPGEDRASAGAVGGAEAQLDLKLVRDGVQVIARGALVCPECDLPLPGRPAVPAFHVLHCAWCGHAAPARALLRADAIDAPGTRVALVARLAAPA